MALLSDGQANNNAFCNQACDGISLKQTSMSKDEFILKLDDYYTTSGTSGLEVFVKNAGSIYDIAINSNVNPEVIVVGAMNENFAPGLWSNNYWGIGCSGISGCTSYGSFDDGVKAYIAQLLNYSTATDMIKSKYTNVTNEEQLNELVEPAVNNLISLRENVFGIPKDVCNEICYSGDYPIDPKDELYSDLQLIHGITFEEILTNYGTTVEDFNAMLQSSIERAGLGTRAGVIAAATTLIGATAEMGYKINYQWGGKYRYAGVRANWGAPADMSYLCDNYESKGYVRSKCETNYSYHGFDCSGFVHWALVNGTGKNLPQPHIEGNQTIPLQADYAVCEPGSALTGNGHIVLIVGIDTEKKQYIVAEATGSDISKNSGGTKLSNFSFNKAGYACYDLHEWYGE